MAKTTRQQRCEVCGSDHSGRRTKAFFDGGEYWVCPACAANIRRRLSSESIRGLKEGTTFIGSRRGSSAAGCGTAVLSTMIIGAAVWWLVASQCSGPSTPITPTPATSPVATPAPQTPAPVIPESEPAPPPAPVVVAPAKAPAPEPPTAPSIDKSEAKQKVRAEFIQKLKDGGVIVEARTIRGAGRLLVKSAFYQIERRDKETTVRTIHEFLWDGIAEDFVTHIADSQSNVEVGKYSKDGLDMRR